MILWELFWTFFKIGLFTFGGGYAMLPLIQEEVLNNAWIDSEVFINFIAVAESTPGPFAINMATYVGSQVGGAYGFFGSLLGSVCTTLGVAMPSFIVILIVAKCYEKFRKNKIVSGCMLGLKPATVGLIGSALISIGITVFFPLGFTTAMFTDIKFYLSVVIFSLTTVLAFKKVHPIIIILISAVLGIIIGFVF